MTRQLQTHSRAYVNPNPIHIEDNKEFLSETYEIELKNPLDTLFPAEFKLRPMTLGMEEYGLDIQNLTVTNFSRAIRQPISNISGMPINMISADILRNFDRYKIAVNIGIWTNDYRRSLADAKVISSKWIDIDSKTHLTRGRNLDNFSRSIQNMSSNSYGKVVLFNKIFITYLKSRVGMQIPTAFSGKFFITCGNIDDKNLVINKGFYDDKKQYVIISPASDINCVWTCIALGSKTIDQIVNTKPYGYAKLGSKLKENCTTNNKNPYPDLIPGDYESICKYVANRERKKLNFLIDDGKEKLIDIKNDAGKKTKTIRLLIRNMHCMLMLETKEISDEQRDKLMKLHNEILSGRKEEMIKVRKPSTKVNSELYSNIWTFDIETYGKSCTKDIMIGLSTKDLDKKIYNELVGHYSSRTQLEKSLQLMNLPTIKHKLKYDDKTNHTYYELYGDDCGKEFISLIGDNKCFNNAIIYAHNGGRFDLPIMIKNYFNVDKRVSFINNGTLHGNGRWIKVTINVNNNTVLFKDSYMLLPGSLAKLCDEYKVVHRKKDSPIIKKVMTNPTKELYKEHYEEISSYLEHDCIGLLEVLEIMNNDVSDEKMLGHTVHKYNSASSLAFNMFLIKYWDDKKFPLFAFRNHMHWVFKMSYHGGRTEAFVLGSVKGRIYYLDFTSMYPYTGTLLLPYGSPKYISNEIIECFPDCKRGGFYNILVRNKPGVKSSLPAFALLDTSFRLVFPYFNDWCVLYYEYSEFINDSEILEEYDIKILDGYEMDLDYVMKNFYEENFKLKAYFKDQGQPSREALAKLNLNGCYGKMGESYCNREGLKVVPNTAFGARIYNQYMNSGLLDSSVGFPDLPVNNLLLKLEGNNDRCKSSLPIGSATTSLARLTIWKACRYIIRKGGRVLYMDTDSIITNYDINKDPEYLKRFKWDGTGKSLGTLKNEIEAYISTKTPGKFFVIEFNEDIKEEYKNVTRLPDFKAENVIKFDEKTPKKIVISCKIKLIEINYIDGKASSFSIVNLPNDTIMKYSHGKSKIMLDNYFKTKYGVDEPFVTEFVGGGCKSYSYRFRDDAVSFESVKLKGFSQSKESPIISTVEKAGDDLTLKFKDGIVVDSEDYKELRKTSFSMNFDLFSKHMNYCYDKAGIYQEQTQFRVSDKFQVDIKDKFPVKIDKVQKKFKPGYSKGKISSEPIIDSFGSEFYTIEPFKVDNKIVHSWYKFNFPDEFEDEKIIDYYKNNNLLEYIKDIK